MKVIFLDIDGVLNSKKSEIIDKNNVALLKLLAERTGAVIVMSSGWKFMFDDDMKPESKEAAHLQDIICEYGIRLFGKTPDFSTEEIRKNRTFSEVKAKEIKAWLSDHTGIESYVVLDDLDLKDGEIASRTVRTNGNIGLSEEDVDAAVRMLDRN
jgi:hydroxymethylpyrimidine pyrophosphatase-like HAD family hydrolase